MILRDYQQKGISDICALFAARRVVEQGHRVAIIVHRQELADQICAALAAEGVRYGVIAAGHPEDPEAGVQVCMVQTLARRLDRLRDIQLLVVDECHHVLAATWFEILQAVPSAFVLGVSATPERLDGKGLGAAFDALVVGPSVKALIKAGWFAPFVVYAPERLIDLKGARTRLTIWRGG
jgi:DNA repair protein RadD